MKQKQMAYPYQLLTLKANQLEVPRCTYQQKLHPEKVKRIVEQFDERIANEPKVSCRDGHYYVFDGQHTIAARVAREGSKEVPIRCRVYFGLSESDEAHLFAEQTGVATPLTAGTKLRARVYSGEPEAVAFVKATNEAGFQIDYDQQRGERKIGCVATALDQYRRVGEKHYEEGLKVILAAWGGEPESLRSGTLSGIIQFVDLYHDEYDASRLIRQLQTVDPLTIYREGQYQGMYYSGYKKYLYEVLRIYNGNDKEGALPIKF